MECLPLAAEPLHGRVLESRRRRRRRRRRRQGDADAQFSLGVCYHEGKGVAKDDARAIELWTRAAKQAGREREERESEEGREGEREKRGTDRGQVAS